MVRPPCCDKQNAKKAPCSSNWGAPPIKEGMKRCGKHRMLRWNYQGLKSFTPQEEEAIIKLHAAIGSRWPIIAQQLPGRTENEIKNHWNSKLKKELTQMGIDPVTHRPFSQILADYGNIGGLSRAVGTPKYIGAIRKDFKKNVNSHSLNPQNTEPPFSSSFTFTSNSEVTNNTTTQIQNNYPSHDLLSQLQAISLVTEGPNHEMNFQSSKTKYEFFSQTSPSSPTISSTSICSSSYNAGQVAKSPDSFRWHEFLLDDSVQSAQNKAESEQEGSNYVTDLSSQNYARQSEMQVTGNADSTSKLSDASLFVEAMLDQESDMFLNFPGLMEEPLYCLS